MTTSWFAPQKLVVGILRVFAVGEWLYFTSPDRRTLSLE
jgi:hypothetical protein